MKIARAAWVAGMGAVVAVAAGLAVAGGPQDEEGPNPPGRAAAKGQPGQGGAMAGFPDLVKGLKETPGCLGVETAQTSSGKLVIFAWFEDKKAAMAWYKSDMHTGAMEQFFGGPSGRAPMADVPDDVPLMTIASITPSRGKTLEGTDLPISQIAIELYRPVNGGVSLGGRFAPEALDVPKMMDYTPNPEAPGGPSRP